MLDSYDKVNPTSLFSYDGAVKKKICFTLGTVTSSLHYIYIIKVWFQQSISGYVY